MPTCRPNHRKPTARQMRRSEALTRPPLRSAPTPRTARTGRRRRGTGRLRAGRGSCRVSSQCTAVPSLDAELGHPVDDGRAVDAEMVRDLLLAQSVALIELPQKVRNLATSVALRHHLFARFRTF